MKIVYAIICVLAIANFSSCKQNHIRTGQVIGVACKYDENGFIDIYANVIFDDSTTVFVPVNQPGTVARILAAEKIGALDDYIAEAYIEDSIFVNIESFYLKGTE